MTDTISFTEEELTEFDVITWMLSSGRQMDRISARLDIDVFLQKHGKEKCDAMFAEITRREKEAKKK